eukprot:5897825-Amphidinium_carterae.1
MRLQWTLHRIRVFEAGLSKVLRHSAKAAEHPIKLMEPLLADREGNPLPLGEGLDTRKYWNPDGMSIFAGHTFTAKLQLPQGVIVFDCHNPDELDAMNVMAFLVTQMHDIALVVDVSAAEASEPGFSGRLYEACPVVKWPRLATDGD